VIGGCGMDGLVKCGRKGLVRSAYALDLRITKKSV
jgi:hypothetical protein